MGFKVVILSPHGFFGQQNVLGKPDTGGQVRRTTLLHISNGSMNFQAPVFVRGSQMPLFGNTHAFLPNQPNPGLKSSIHFKRASKHAIGLCR